MKLRFERIEKFLGVILSSNLNRMIKLGLSPQIPDDEKEYKLIDYKINKFTYKDKEEYYNILFLITDTNIGSEIMHTIKLVDSIEYEYVYYNQKASLKMWIYGKNIESFNKYIDKSGKVDTIDDLKYSENYRITINPDWNFILYNNMNNELFNKERFNDIEYIKMRVDEEMKDFMYVKPIFSEKLFAINSKKIFVIMPFREDKYNYIYNNILKYELENIGFNCHRVDDSYYTGNVMEKIWIELNEADIIIAEISTKNPNVMYELGIAHTIGKKVIILTENEDDIPFDLRMYRYIKYDINNEREEFIKKLLDIVIAETRDDNY